jgi:hypothetical protein
MEAFLGENFTKYMKLLVALKFDGLSLFYFFLISEYIIKLNHKQNIYK